MDLNYFFEDMAACPCPKAFDGEPWEALKKKETYFDFSHNVIEGELHPSVVITGKVKIGKGTIISPYVVIEGPVIIGQNCTVRPFALLRPGTIIGDNCLIGTASEIKNAIIFSETKISSKSFVGDTIMGKSSRTGADTIFANRRFDQSDILVKIEGQKVNTGLDKFGAIIGDHVRFGCNCVTLPGTLIGKHTWITPQVCLGGFIEKEKIIKGRFTIEVEDKERKNLSFIDKEGKI